ncbi:unnamed protein product [Closterium sp. NIES-65]|nr:unnamed protein product [Closterium sp. NIES-65]
MPAVLSVLVPVLTPVQAMLIPFFPPLDTPFLLLLSRSFLPVASTPSCSLRSSTPSLTFVPPPPSVPRPRGVSPARPFLRGVPCAVPSLPGERVRNSLLHLQLSRLPPYASRASLSPLILPPPLPSFPPSPSPDLFLHPTL